MCRDEICHIIMKAFYIVMKHAVLCTVARCCEYVTSTLSLSLPEDLVQISEEDATNLEHSLGRQRTASTLSTTTQPSPKLYRCYQVTIYLFVKTKEIIVALVYLIWRFLELHMHKIATLVLFAVALSEISAGYWILLLLLLITIPLPYLNPLLYPLVTLYLGLLTTMKMIYQVPIVQQKYFDFNSSDCRVRQGFALLPTVWISPAT